MFLVLLTVAIFLLTYNYLKLQKSRQQRVHQEHLTVLEKKYIAKEAKIREEYLQEKQMYIRKIKSNNNKILQTQEKLSIVENNVKDAEARLQSKKILISDLKNRYIPPEKIHLFIHTFNTYIENVFEVKKEQFYEEAIDKMVFRKLDPTKASKLVIQILKELPDDVRNYREDFKKIEEQTTFEDLVFLKMIQETGAEVLKNFLNELKINQDLIKVLSKHIDVNFPDAMQALKEIMDISENLTYQRKIDIVVANKKEQKLVEKIIARLEVRNIKMNFIVDDIVMGGAIFEDQYFAIDLSHLKMIEVIALNWNRKEES